MHYLDNVSFLFTACHESCEFECNGPGNKACKACRNGYQMEDGECKGKLTQSSALSFHVKFLFNVESFCSLLADCKIPS